MLYLSYIGVINGEGARLLVFNEYIHCSDAFSKRGWVWRISRYPIR